MEIEDAHRLGYERVDDDPNVSVLLATMDTTAEWSATRELRSWERDQLRLSDGQRLLDVGRGLAEAALALAHDLGDDGEVLGIDVSEEMLGIARSNARIRVDHQGGRPSEPVLDESHDVRSRGRSPDSIGASDDRVRWHDRSHTLGGRRAECPDGPLVSASRRYQVTVTLFEQVFVPASQIW